jgi:hypothetical protein
MRLLKEGAGLIFHEDESPFFKNHESVCFPANTRTRSVAGGRLANAAAVDASASAHPRIPIMTVAVISGEIAFVSLLHTS